MNKLKINKTRLEEVINYQGIKFGVIRKNANMQGNSATSYKDCNDDCFNCDKFLNRSLALFDKERNNDYCMSLKVIERFSDSVVNDLSTDPQEHLGVGTVTYDCHSDIIDHNETRSLYLRGKK